MPKPQPTREALALVEALKERGVYAETEHWDGHKHIDIFVPSLKLYIEVDGIRHDISALQIATDLKRDHYSNRESVVNGFAFPVIAIPFGADTTTLCRYYASSEEINSEHIAVLLDSSYPMRDGVRRIHIIPVSQAGISHFNPGPIFYLAII
jgi:hypothetical protein